MYHRIRPLQKKTGLLMDLSGVKLAAKKYGIFAGFPDSNSALFRLVSYFPRTS